MQSVGGNAGRLHTIKRLDLNKIILTIFGFVISNLLLAQSDVDRIYENYSNAKWQMIPSQYVTQIILQSDSTYIDKTFQGIINDSKNNYQDWKVTEQKGKWYLDKKTLILKRGDMIARYKMTNHYIKPKRFQIGYDGAKVIHYRKWILEKRPKYKLKRN